jgi:hypothetical protein
MGNKHTKQEYVTLLNTLGDLLWKLTSNEYLGKEQEIIETLAHNISDEDFNFVLNCTYFNPVHYLIISALWLPHNVYIQLCSLLPKIIYKCKDTLHHKTKLLIFQNNNNVSTINLKYIQYEKVKVSLMRRGTMDNLSQYKCEIRRSSLTQPKSELHDNTEKLVSYTSFAEPEEQNNNKVLKPPPPIKKKEDDNKDNLHLERSITYYMLSDEEKKRYDNNSNNIPKDYQEKKVSSKMLWFTYALYNECLWNQQPSTSNLIEEIGIGEMKYLSLISYLQIKCGKFSSIKDSSTNLVHIYKLIMNITIINRPRRKSSIKDTIKHIFS